MKSVKKKPNPDMDRLLVKCLLNEATEAECRQVDAWRAMAPANQQYAADFERIWEESYLLLPASTVSETEAWERFKQSGRFPATKPGNGKVVSLTRRRYYWLGAVASILILCLAGWWYIPGRHGEGMLLSLQTQAAVLTDTLPDGSRVTLNKHSSLLYPKQFKGDTRPVNLDGEAFFLVAHQAKQPFVVKVNGLTIRDIGTSFNVKAKGTQTEVIVETGEVEVMNGAHSTRVLAGERIIVSATDAEPLKTSSTDALYQYYRTKEFACHATPLWKLVEALNEAYDVHIVIEGNEVRNLSLTTTFRNESLESILGVVTQTLRLSQERKGREIILKLKHIDR